MFTTHRFLALPVLAMGLVSSAAYAQANPVSQLSGLVQDPTGAAIPGAAVAVTNVDTGAKRSETSNDSGAYSFNALPAGHYKLEVTKDGFKSYSQTVELQVNSNPSITVPLSIGETSETVEVTGSAALVETQSVGVGQVVDQKQIVDLPLNGRDATQLITLSGAAVQAPVTNGSTAGGVVNTLNYPGAPSYSLAGGQANATNYFLDGAYHMDIRTNVGLPLPFPDALDQFKVETSSLAANYGSLPGGAVNAVTRSGTNKFHGTVFEFIRNGAVNAQNYFYKAGGARDSLKRNQYGGTIGGPVIKDKLFFFAGLQVTNIRSNPFLSTFTVPNAVRNNGDFTTLLSSTCNFTGTVKAPYTSKVINPATFNPVAKAILNYLPTTTDPCGKINVVTPTDSNEYMGVGRVDYQQSAKDAINFRYFVSDYTLAGQFVNQNLLTAATPGLKDRVTGIELGDTYIVTPNIVNALRLFYTRTAIQRQGPPGVPTPTQLGQNSTSPIANYVGQLSVTGYFSTAANPGYIYSNTLGLAEDITWTKGKHTVIGGFYMTHGSLFANGQYQMNPRNAFDGTLTGSAMVDFLTGNLDTFQQGNGQTGNERVNQPALYVQDNWKLTSKFQLNAGIRWDPYMPQKQKYNQVADFSMAAFQAGTGSKVFPNSPAGITYPGDSGFSGQSATLHRYGDFAPRVGVVYSPRGDGREVFRAGYGLFFTGSYLWQTMHIPLNAPWGNTIILTAPGGGLSNPWASYAGGNPFPTKPVSASTVFPLQGTYVFEPQNLHATSVQQYNFSYQRQIGPATAFSVTYLGNHTEHQALGNENNPSTYIPGTSTGVAGSCGFLTGANLPKAGAACSSTANTQARRVFAQINPTAGPYFAGTAILNDSFTGNYNGLLTSVNHRLRSGLNVIANYTWSHCLNFGDNGQDISNQFQNPANPNSEYANCSLDRRNLANISVVGNTPKFQDRVARAFLTGWTGSAIYTYQSGAPVNPTRGTDNSLSAYNQDRLNIVGDVNANAPHSVTNYWNKAAFASAPVGQFGNAQRNYLTGPSIWDTDVAVWREFGYKDRANIQLRFEAFNVFNHPRYTPPIAAFNSATFNQITTALDPRILQAAAKINF